MQHSRCAGARCAPHAPVAPAPRHALGPRLGHTATSAAVAAAADTFNFSPDSIDEQRIKLLASLEPNSIRFLTDLELAARSGSAGSGGMDAALVKWYFHPTVGPKLTSGTWMSELPESLRKLQQVAGMQSGELDFDNMPWQDILGGSGA